MKAPSGKAAEETLTSLNRDVENANGKVEKQDLTKLQERQEAAQIIAQFGSKLVGNLAQEMGWAEGSLEKVALHGLVGYLSGKVGGGNGTAGALAAMGSEYLNTEIANYLKENTDLTASQRNAIQLASAAGIGAAIGAGLGDSNVVKQSALQSVNTEAFNRQLHPDEQQRIEELAQGDKEKRARLEAAACALVHCSSQIPNDDPEYTEIYQAAKSLEELGNQPEFKAERELLSKQLAHYDPLDSLSGYRRPLFEYTSANKLSDYDASGPKVIARVGGLAQATGGVAATTFGMGLCETGVGCIAGVPVTAYGVDNFVSGARTAYSGKYHSTVGAKAITELTGISNETAEMVYGVPTIIYGGKSIISGVSTVGKVAAKEASQIAGATKHMVGEIGKDIKGGGSAANNITQNRYVNMRETTSYLSEKGIEKSMVATRKLNNSIENTGVRNFGVAAISGVVGTTVSEAVDYLSGKEITGSNLLDSGRSILINSGTSGVSANLSPLQNLVGNTIFGVTLQGQSLSDASTNSLIGIGASKGVNKVEVLDKSSQDVVSTFLTERAAKKKDELLKSREDKNKDSKK